MRKGIILAGGGIGSPRARLSAHLRIADYDQQLLRQLRTASVSRKTHSADDRPTARRQVIAGLVYDGGRNIRDWLHLEDHCRGIDAVLKQGKIGKVCNIGGRSERENIHLVRMLCAVLGHHLLDPRARRALS